MQNKSVYKADSPLCVHVNSQAFGIHCGIAVYSEEITSRLSQYPDMKIDALYVSVSESERHSRIPLRRVNFPEHLAFNERCQMNIDAVRTFASKIIHRLSGSSESYNDLVDGSSDDVYLFFDNRIPRIKINGKIAVVIHDIKPLRIMGRNVITNCINKYIVRHNTAAALAQASAIITVSEYSRQDIAEYFGISPDKIHVVYNAVDIPFFSRERTSPEKFMHLRSEYGLPEKYILYFGGCVKSKNVARLIEAYAALPETLRREYKLVITNPMKYVKKCAQRCGVSGSVIYLHSVPEDDKPALYQMAALFVWPSLLEGFGLPVVEAQASGVPVVCSNASSMPEVAGDAAVLFDPYDVKSIASAVERVLTDEGLRDELVAKGYENIERFSWEESARKLHDIIISM